MSIFKRTQRKYVKKAYRVRNWRDYEAGLRNRGSLTVWISLTAGKLVNWDAPRPRRRKPGRQRKYSNHAIETAVTLGMVFHLSSRQSEGLLRSLFALMKLDNDVPDHTTISRRKAKLGKVPFYQDKQKTPLHILIDSSGLAVHAGQLRRAPKSRVCIVKTAPPTKSRTYAPLEFRAEDGETPPLCSTLLSSSSHLASVPFGRCVGAAPTWCWRTSLCGSK